VNVTRTLCTLTLFALAAAPAQANPDEDAQATKVIYFIGDGMGISQVTLGRLAAQRLGQTYHFDRVPAIGLASTTSSNSPVTDSAAAGTALATGVKTKNWSVGRDADGQALETLIDVAHRAGWATGLLTTTRLTHATPAAFAAHVWHRNEEAAIARQMATKGYPDLLIGGGARMFGEAERAQLSANGYQVITDLAALAEAKGAKVAGLLSSSHLPFAIDREEGHPSLKELTAKSVELLEAQGKGFMLMVEAGRIDHAGHAHDAAALIHEQLDMDAALGWALDYQREHPETLIVVTSDHATGALAISEQLQLVRLIRARASVEAIMKRIRKSGLSREQWAPLIKKEVLSNYSEVELEDWEIEELLAHDDKYFEAMGLGHAIAARFGVSWYDLEWQHENLKGTHGHNGGMVGVYAAGPQASRFVGIYENTEIPLRIAEIAGLPRPGKVLQHK
jgi:alkaline phosphatase